METGGIRKMGRHFFIWKKWGRKEIGSKIFTLQFWLKQQLIVGPIMKYLYIMEFKVMWYFNKIYQQIVDISLGVWAWFIERRETNTQHE